MIKHAVKVAMVEDIEIGKGLAIPSEVSGHPTPIAVFHTDEGFRAIEDTCTHLNASLAKGTIVDGEVDCWLHHGRFCPNTGAATRYPARGVLETFPVELRGDEIWLVAQA